MAKVFTLCACGSHSFLCCRECVQLIYDSILGTIRGNRFVDITTPWPVVIKEKWSGVQFFFLKRIALHSKTLSSYQNLILTTEKAISLKHYLNKKCPLCNCSGVHIFLSEQNVGFKGIIINRDVLIFVLFTSFMYICNCSNCNTITLL